jgi:ribosome-associated heat shock protein Hsp15
MSDTPLKVRLDKYLWSIRMYKTRTLATDQINTGKVKCNGVDVKPSKVVQVGEIFELKREGGLKQLIQCTAILDKRVAYTEAAKFYIDLTPEEDLHADKLRSAFSFNTGKRLSKQGRPTKKDRRGWEDVMED